MSHLRLSIALASLGLVAPAARAGAQQPAGDTARLGTVVVTATRLPTPLGATPATVTVLSGDELRARGVVHVADALREVPSVMLVQGGSYGAASSLFLRGGNSNYTKVLVDGVPVNNPGGGFDFAHLTVDDVERIEVVRGPASVLYGTDAVAGVVNVITRRGGASRLTAGVRGGGYGTREGELEAQGRAGALAWSLGGGHRRTDGVYDFNSQYRNTSVAGSAGAAGAAGDVRVSARLTDARYHFPTDFAGLPTDSNQYTDDRRLALALDAGRTVASGIEARLLATSADIETASRNDPDDASDVPTSTSRNETYRRGADARLNVAAGALGTLTVGGQLERQQFRPFDTEGALPAHHRVNAGGYAQLAAVRGALDYALGARVDDNSVFGRFATGRAGVGYRFASGTRLRGSLGNAFKEPGFEEQFNTAWTRGNPALDPERVTTWEAALAQSLAGGCLTVGATYFDQYYRDLIQYAYRGGPDSTDYANVPNATSRGVELELAAPALGRGFAFTGSFTRLRTRAESADGTPGTYQGGRPLLRRPASQGSATLGWSRAHRGSLAATINAIGRRDDLRFNPDFTVSRVALAGYATVDLSAEATILAAGATRLALTARVENALDRRFEPVLGYRSVGRRALVGARVERY